MTVGDLRRRVGEILEWFTHEVESQEPMRVAKACRRTTDFFDQVEAFTGEIDVSDPDEWESL